MKAAYSPMSNLDLSLRCDEDFPVAKGHEVNNRDELARFNTHDPAVLSRHS